MIGSLRGEVLERSAEGTVLIDVAGVGYEVSVAPRTFGELEPTSAAFEGTLAGVKRAVAARLCLMDA